MVLIHNSWCPYCKQVTVHYGKNCSICAPDIIKGTGIYHRLTRGNKNADGTWLEYAEGEE